MGLRHGGGSGVPVPHGAPVAAGWWARPSLPSVSRSPARRNANKMVIMPQTSSGKGFETDEKPYLRVRPLLLITWSEAVNSADTAIMGNQPAPAPARRIEGCPGAGWGQASVGWGAPAALRVGEIQGKRVKTSGQAAARCSGMVPLVYGKHAGVNEGHGVEQGWYPGHPQQSWGDLGDDALCAGHLPPQEGTWLGMATRLRPQDGGVRGVRSHHDLPCAGCPSGEHQGPFTH